MAASSMRKEHDAAAAPADAGYRIGFTTTPSAASPCGSCGQGRGFCGKGLHDPVGEGVLLVVSATFFRLLSVLLITTASAASPCRLLDPVRERDLLVGPPPLSSIGWVRGGGDLLGRQRGEDAEVVPLLLEVLLPIDEDSAFRSKNAF